MTPRELYWTGRHLFSLLRQRRLSQQALRWGDWRRFWASFRRYRALDAGAADPEWRHVYPCLGDDTQQTAIEPIYFYQDAWAFELIARVQPPWHVDVGSHHKYVALLSKIVKVTMVDIRPLPLPMETLKFQQGSILDLPFADGSVPSVSSLCVVEHIGLGRYGDPLDSHGTEKAFAELKRIVAPGGDLYVSLPLDDSNRVYFNAHRAFLEDYVLELARPFELIERRYIYGNDFVSEQRSGIGVGCYHLRAPGRAVQAANGSDGSLHR